ncbi:MAG: hypothetical protein HUK25_07980, partial [Treponema sp.]|nr:hypothetical protein [Treponema sp.]
TASVKLFVSQNTDRPQIVLTSIEVDEDNPTTLSHGDILGTITDDDGITSFKIQVTKNNVSAPEDADWKAADKDGTQTKLNYSIPKTGTPATADGNWKIWFKVTDTEGETFISAVTTIDAQKLKTPRISTLGGSKVVGNPVEYSVDSTAPVIKAIKVTRNSANAKNELSQGDYYGGTLRPEIDVEVDAEDNVTAKSELKVSYSVSGTDSSGKTVTDTKEISYNAGTGKYTDTIDFTEMNGAVTVSFKVADKSGEPATKSVTVFADNLPPNEENSAITNASPSPTAEVTGNVSFSANISDENTGRSGINTSEVYYCIPKTTETEDTVTWIKNDGYLTVSDVLLKLEIDSLSTSNAEITSGYEGYEEISGSKVYNIPVWFKVSDKMGNTSIIKGNTIKYNPDAARPRVQITYPVHNAKTAGNKDYVVLGGTLRFSGTAEDNVGVKAVYVQYDINGDGLYNATDAAWLKGKGYTINNISTGSEITNGTYPDDLWGIKASGQQSWNVEFDAKKLETNLEIGKDGNAEKTLNIRVRAVDTDTTTHLSAFSSELHVSVNNTAPVFDEFKLVQYSDSTYTTKIQDVKYTAGEYIHGSNWRLETNVTDSNGIYQVKAQNQELITYAADDETITNTDSQLTSITDGYDIKLKLDTTQAIVKVQLEAIDDDGENKKSTYAECTINIDNTPPVFKDGTSGELVLWRGIYNSSKIGKDESSGEVFIENTNGWTTLASKVNEAQSGFDKAIYYAKRVSSTSGTRLYNVMEDTGISRTENRTDLTGSGLTEQDGLYVLTKTVTRDSSDLHKIVVNATGIGDLNYIRTGGAVFIGGNYKVIQTYTRDSANQITVTFAEEVDISYTEAKFVYGMVVDHTGESRNTDGSIKGDDGDGMVESYSKNGFDYTWDAAFNSLNIPNGPIEIHVVVFDKAGNSVHGSVETKVSNSAPRITSVTLGTDLNLDGTVDADTETTTFYAFKNSYGDIDTTQGKDVWDLVTRDETESLGRDWTIKNKFTMEPEFVGGTTPFYYSFTKAVGTGTGKRLTKDDAVKATYKAKTYVSANTGTEGKIYEDADDKKISFDNKTVNGGTETYDSTTGEDGLNTYRFIFWDSQEDDTEPMGNGWCILNMELKQDVVDGKRPETFVHPFFWNGKGSGKNSVAWETVSGKLKAKGHIELEKDWLSASGYDSTATSG